MLGAVRQNQNMADTSKAQKLASARKRFKELKDQKKNAKNTENLENKADVDSLTSSTHSSIAVNEPVNAPYDTVTPQLPNYFNNTNYETSLQQTFFDNYVQPASNLNSENIQNNIADDASNFYSPTTNGINNEESFGASDNHIDFFNNIQKDVDQYSLFPPQHSHNFATDNVSESHQLEEHELLETHKKDHHNMVSERDTQVLMNYLQDHEITDAIKEENLGINSSDPIADDHKFNNINEYPVSQSITDLEKRNLELTSLYEQEKIKNDQITTILQDIEDKNYKLQNELKSKETNTEDLLKQEIIQLKNELQGRIQAMEILVAQKTELSASSSQLEALIKQKTVECEELQARLKTSRSLVADMEKDLHNMKNEKFKFDNKGKEQIDQYEKLKLEYDKLKEHNEEINQDLLECRERLKNSADSYCSIEQQFQDVSSKLSLANIKIQQLTTGETATEDNKNEEIHNLEKEINTLKQMLKDVTKERDDSNQQYQQYAQQLNNQLENVTGKLEQLQQENENLHIQEQQRIKHIGDLERQLQSFQNEPMCFSQKVNPDVSLKQELETTKELLIQLQMEKTSLEEDCTKIANEKEMLLKELTAKNESLSQLETMIEQLRGNQPDSVKLLATMESDKVAAARAISQNMELKKQMEGMNEVFLKLNNDKVELTERLTIEQKSNKDLIEKLQKTEINLQTLVNAIEIKDKELTYLRDSSEQLNKQALQQEQLNDRLRHYEAQDHSAHALQTELQEAKTIIASLSNELNQLKSTKENNSQDNEEHHEIFELKQKLDELQLRNAQIELKANQQINQVDEMHENIRDKNDNDEIDQEVAMKYLQDKFTRTMQDIAELQDEKQRLEHLVLQLQSETETIGEYVALYQHQRMVLKQRALEKDHQLKQLANDREQMKEKLHKLNHLIHKVVSNGNSSDTNENKGDKENFIINENNVEKLDVKLNDCTANEIMSLLSEIETSNLVQPSENYHHCPWCSGQLITV